ncbi:la-related protein 4-like isoform X2 [Saccostrea echinata]|uniref:la-related protein 4-like isoform X2 n=1 Tax=Saccostrea echinata TaxID=191078 RepID=UPI002A80AB37|nr:la-related protein 4-like isoform X2 [Saccostrea echinata]
MVSIAKVELKANLEENSAALMTSDRGHDRGAELPLTSPVSPKTAGLNPNASVFLSTKQCSPTDTAQWDGGITANGYQYANGDVSSPELGGVYHQPDSPLQSNVLGEDANSSVGFPNSDNSVLSIAEDEGVITDGSMDEDSIRQLLKTQLENCFSRDSLSSDTYLQSQMDSDQYVPISTIASLDQIQELTTDLQLIVQLLRECASVQVDEKGEKVRPNLNRCIVILREIPESTPVEEVQGLFAGENCPKFVSCEFAHNNNWYVTFDSDTDAQRAYQYLREEVRNFQGKPIMARIKAKPLIRMTYSSNGYKSRYHQQLQQQQQAQVNAQAMQQVVQPTSPSESQATVATMTSQPFSTQQASVPLMSSVPQYINGHPLPFFAPNPLLSQWPTSPTLLDPSMNESLLQVLAMNGYQPTSIKLNTTAPRHQYSNMNRNRNNGRPNRPSNQERMDNRPNYERNNSINHNRTSPRHHDNSQMSPAPYSSRNRGENNNHSHGSSMQQQGHNNLDTNNSSISSSRQSDGLPPVQRGYRSRRRREEDGGPRRQLPSREKPAAETQFDLEINSFPPLPGPVPANSSSSNNEVFESKLSDVVKGTAKPIVRENVIKPQVSQPVQQSSQSQHSEPVGVPANPRPPTPPSQPPKDNSSNNSNNSALNGASAGPAPTAVVASTSSSGGNVAPPPRIPSPPAVSPQKPQKPSSSIQEPVVNHVDVHASTVSKSAPVNQVKAVSVDNNSPVKLSYAQMVQRGRDSDSAPESKNNSDSESESVQQNTLKEQSQAKTSTAKKDQTRKDSELPKEQRHFSGRRSKENRERRDRRRSERETARSSTK